MKSLIHECSFSWQQTSKLHWNKNYYLKLTKRAKETQNMDLRLLYYANGTRVENQLLLLILHQSNGKHALQSCHQIL
jgi:hypothetical protein